MRKRIDYVQWLYRVNLLLNALADTNHRELSAYPWAQWYAEGISPGDAADRSLDYMLTEIVSVNHKQLMNEGI